MLITHFPLVLLITSAVAVPLISTVTVDETSKTLETPSVTERGSEVEALVERAKDKGDSVSLPVRIMEDIILRDENSQARKLKRGLWHDIQCLWYCSEANDSMCGEC